MAYDTLKAAIEQSIKPNGNQAITGQVLQNILLEMVNMLGSGAVYGGEIVPADAVLESDTAQAYIAKTQGTYTNYGGLTLAEGEVAIISNVTGKWSKTTIYIGNEGGGGDANAAEMLLAVRAAARALGAAVWKSGDVAVSSSTLGITGQSSDIWIYLAASGDEAITATYNYRSGGKASQVTIPQNGVNILVVDGARVGSDDNLTFSAAHSGVMVAAVAVEEVRTSVVKGQFDPVATWKEKMAAVRAAGGIGTEATADSVTIKLNTTMLDGNTTPGPQQTATIEAATTENAGLMSATDKTKLNELAAGGTDGGAPLVLDLSSVQLNGETTDNVDIGADIGKILAAIDDNKTIVLRTSELGILYPSTIQMDGGGARLVGGSADYTDWTVVLAAGTNAGTCKVQFSYATPPFVTGSGVTGIRVVAELPSDPLDGILYIVTGTEEA